MEPIGVNAAMQRPKGIDGSDTAWLLTSTALVLFMTPGLAFFYGGLVKGANVLNTMMMSIISMGVVSLPWCIVGFSLAFDEGCTYIGGFGYLGLRGLEGEVWPGTGLPDLLFVCYQMTFVIIASAIISGAVVERMRFGAYVAFIVLWSLLVYAPVCHWVWGPGGWVEEMGAKDFAGGIVVHETTAASALVLSMLLGPRSGFQDAAAKVEPHNVPFVILGGAMLWFGWSGFNGGAALGATADAARAVLNTYLAGAASLVVWAVMERIYLKHLSAVGTITGAVVGLVIITPAAGFVNPVGAISMGGLGCILVYPLFRLNRTLVDDTLDAFPCHGASGFVGTVLTGIFALDGGLLHGGDWRLLGVQLATALVAFAYAGVASAILYGMLSRCMRMRVSRSDEEVGLDDVVHGEKAYIGGVEASPTKSHRPSAKGHAPLSAGVSGGASAGEEAPVAEGRSGESDLVVVAV